MESTIVLYYWVFTFSAAVFATVDNKRLAEAGYESWGGAFGTFVLNLLFMPLAFPMYLAHRSDSIRSGALHKK